MTHPCRVLLGPQNPARNLGNAIANAAVPDGRLAVISAGWQEAEGDIDDVAELVGRPVEDLRLYQRAEEVIRADDALAADIRQRQDRLIGQQRLYRQRLRQLCIAARLMLEAEGNADAVLAEQRHAIAQLRALDRHHLNRSNTLWQEFLARHDPDSHALLAPHAQEIRDIIDGSSGVVITGGNVVVLINRMRLFGVDRMLGNCNVIAWSAGAMALTGRIVLFHDRSPQGRRDAEVLGAGCNVVPGYVFLPDARHRLDSDDRQHTEVLSRRFAPDTCVALDNGTELRLDDRGVSSASGTRRLNRYGRLVKVKAA